MNRSQQGREGEERASRFLEEQGYRIVRRNYRTRSAEIDIIADDRGTTCFVEVRSKGSDAYGSAEESITRAKRRKISAAAVQYLKETGKLDSSARFDVVSISGTAAPELFKNAFELEGDI
ncbi:MAG: YraN family protein [Deltaproteobacteria bacterium]